MSNNETLIKELKNLLEDARKSVLKEINHKSNFIQRIFRASADDLSEAQSSLSKAINVTGKLGSSDSEAVAKLQTHLNEKSQRIQELEAKLKQEDTELEMLREKTKSQTKEIEKLKANLSESKEQKPAPVQNTDTSKFEKEIEELKLKNKDLKERLDGSRAQEQEAWELSVEFSQRLKKLKTELVSS